MKHMKKIELFLLVSISFVMLTQMISADSEGEIIPPEGTVIEINEDIVDYGFCLIGDSLEKLFVLKNTGLDIIKLGTKDPSYFKGVYDNINHPQDFWEFNPRQGDEPEQLIDRGKEKEFIMRYYASEDTSKYKAGKKLVKLTLGLFDSKIPNEPSPGYKDMVALDSFLLIARKTTHYIDGYENEYNFDSVYVKPPAKVSWIWQVKNVSKSDLVIESDTIIPLSPNPDFRINKILNQPIYQKNVIPMEIEYYPTDNGGDSAIYQLKYRPHPVLLPDSVDYAKVKLFGIGVKQNLDIYFSNVDHHGDTIDVGEVWVGKKKEDVMVVLKNEGNLRFGAVSQVIKNKKDEIDTLFSIISPLKEIPFHLDILKTDTFKIEFHPKERGTFIARYVIESDIASRNIKGIPAEGLQKIIYLKGTGIEPEISVAIDTLDFGNIVHHQDCPSSATISIPINNLGNTTLWIQDALIDPPFTRILIDTIAANSQRNMLIIFNADSSLELGDYSDTLFIVSRDVRPPKDTLKIIVNASSVEPQQTRLYIPKDIKAKPGRLISVPIIVDKNNINFARTFSDTLTFDTTLLRYNDFENLGTASEGAEKGSIIINPDTASSRLGINIKMPENVFFRQSDTLIILKFNTYLGDNVSTYIAFAKPQFGDGPCSKVLTPITTNGIFSLDSICGLNLKAIPHTTKKFRFEDIYPNPANEKIQFEYEMAFSTVIKISVYNSFGELVEKLIDSSLPAGTYLLTHPTNNMTPGIYYFEMQAGLFRHIKKVVLTK